MRNRRGMTLIEMLVALTVFSIVLGGALGFMNKQSRSFDKSAVDMGMLQNLSFAGELMEQEFRLAGANVPFKEPAVVYAGANAFIFNADYASATDSLYAVYFNPGLPSGQVSALTASQRFALSGTSPAFSYPDSNYYADGSSSINSPAETITWFFTPDTSTTDANDYVLMRQINNATPEVVIRNVLPTTGRNFFRYYYRRIPVSGTTSSSLDTVPTAWMPVKHNLAIHGSPGDTAANARVDSLALIEVSFTVTNGQTGTNQRTRAINFMVSMPNVQTKRVTTCGDAPIFGSAVAATWTVDALASPPDTFMMLTWTRAVDETAGELDVQNYIVWRRLNGATTWGEPIATVPAGDPTPSYNDPTVHPNVGQTWQYAVAAQDCTPSFSTQSVVTASPTFP
jgi:prepilin-type N-terminal cleavage/methylation domain-containing protein